MNMQINWKSSLAPATLALSAFVALAPAGAVAQTAYPTTTVQVVVPFPPGGGTDFIARFITEGLTAAFPQPVTIDNRPGAATIIATEHVRTSAPDGHTILMVTNSFISNAAMLPEAKYDPLNDFEPIILLGLAPNVMTVSKDSPYNTFEEMVVAAKTAPESVSSVTYGPASIQTFSFHLIRENRGADFLLIPYQGHQQALPAVLSHEVDILFPSITAVLSAIKSNQLKPIAIASDARSPLLPETPTFAESGIPLEIGTWYAFLAPKGTPKEIVDKLYTEISAILAKDQVRKALEDQGIQIRAWDGAKLKAMMVGQLAQWKEFKASIK